TPANLTVTGVTAAGKAYDGTTNATPSISNPALSGFQNGDSSSNVQLVTSGATVAFTSANVGNVPVTVAGLTLTGAASANYTLTQPTPSANISARDLTVTANDDSKTYGQTVTYGAGSVAFTPLGLQNSETIGSVTLASTGGLNSAIVATYPIAASAATGGTFTAANYNISYLAGTLTVNPAPVTATAGTYSGVYDGSEHALTDCAVTGTFKGDLTCTNSQPSVGPDVTSGTV